MVPPPIVITRAAVKTRITGSIGTSFSANKAATMTNVPATCVAVFMGRVRYGKAR